MASTNAEPSSVRKTERAARSSLMLPSPFRNRARSALSSHPSAEAVADPIADAAEHEEVEREQAPAQQGKLRFGRAILRRVRTAHLQAALDEAHERPVDGGGHDRARDGADHAAK